MLRALFLCEHHRLGLFMLVSAESCISVWTLKTRTLHTCQCRELYFFVNTEDFDISYFSVPRAVFLCERSHGESSQQKQWAYPWWVLCVCLYQSQPVEVVWLESAKYHPPHTHTHFKPWVTQWVCHLTKLFVLYSDQLKVNKFPCTLLSLELSELLHFFIPVLGNLGVHTISGE